MLTPNIQSIPIPSDRYGPVIVFLGRGSNLVSNFVCGVTMFVCYRNSENLSRCTNELRHCTAKFQLVINLYYFQDSVIASRHNIKEKERMRVRPLKSKTLSFEGVACAKESLYGPLRSTRIFKILVNIP